VCDASAFWRTTGGPGSACRSEAWGRSASRSVRAEVRPGRVSPRVRGGREDDCDAEFRYGHESVDLAPVQYCTMWPLNWAFPPHRCRAGHCENLPGLHQDSDSPPYRAACKPVLLHELSLGSDRASWCPISSPDTRTQNLGELPVRRERGAVINLRIRINGHSWKLGVLLRGGTSGYV
jgi:hypothetical protein